MIVNINTKSWHYRLANHYGPGRLHASNFCEYINCVMKGALVLLIISAAATAVLVSFEHVIIAGIVALIYGHFVFDTVMALAFGVMVAFGAVAIVAGGVWLKNIIKDKLQADWSKSKEPSFVEATYHKFHDKVCFGIKYDDEDEQERN